MDDTRPSDEERLPWLHAPRRPKSAPRRITGKAKPRRAETPIFVLLSLFMLAGIGVIAFLAGRGSVPIRPVADEAGTGTAAAGDGGFAACDCSSCRARPLRQRPWPSLLLRRRRSAARSASAVVAKVGQGAIGACRARRRSRGSRPRARSAAAKIASDARRRAADAGALRAALRLCRAAVAGQAGARDPAWRLLRSAPRRCGVAAGGAGLSLSRQAAQGGGPGARDGRTSRSITGSSLAPARGAMRASCAATCCRSDAVAASSDVARKISLPFRAPAFRIGHGQRSG